MAKILITGASSGLGAALALSYSKGGTALALWGRDQERLDQVAIECRARGAQAEILSLDIRDIDLLIRRLRELDERCELDLAIFNAGVGGTTPYEHRSEAPERAYEQATVNFTAPIVGAATIGERMAARGHGHIVLIGSVAGSFPLPMSPAYSAAKAGLAMFAEALQLRLEFHGVAVTLALPGFVDTPMSRGVAGPQPFLMTAEAAAAVIVRKVARRSPRFALPRPYGALQALAHVLPRALTRSVLRNLHRRLEAQARSDKFNRIG